MDHADYILLKILAVKTRDKTTVKLLNHKLRYRKPEILLAFLLKFMDDRRHHNSTKLRIQSVRRFLCWYRSDRFSRAVMVMVGADGSDSELLAATKCTPRLQ